MCVLVKPVMDPASIQWDYYKQQFEYMTHGFNQPDLHALQWACDYKDKHGGHITIMMAVDAEQDIKPEQLLKHDIDECVLIKCEKLNRYRNETAFLLADLLKKQIFDVILCGTQSEDVHAGITPFMLAELLGIPCISNIHHIDPSSETKWQVQRKAGRDIVQTYEIELPAVIGVVSSIARRRYVSRYTADAKSNKGYITTVDGHIDKEPDIKVLRLSEPEPNIRYFNIPSSSLSAEKRLLEVMGFGQGSKADPAGKVAAENSDKHIHYLKEKILKWLKED